MRAAVVLVALVLAPMPVAAQEAASPPVQGPTFRTGVDLITLDVAAVDDEGRPVDGLQAPEFTVQIDGRPRRIVSVEQVRFPVPEPAVRNARRPPVVERVETFFSTNLAPQEGRMIVVAVDELNIRPGNVRPLLATAADFVESLNPADRVAFYAYPQPGAFVDFTDDHARIRRAMELVVGNQVPFRGRYNIGLYEAVQIILKNNLILAESVFVRECRRAADRNRDICEQEILSEMTTLISKVRADRQQSLLGLQDLLRRLRTLDGPKALVIISEGLVLEDPTDLNDTIRLAAAAQASVHVLLMDVIRGADVTSGVMPPTMSEDRELQVEGLREMAFAARGALHNVFGNGRSAFDRLASELSSYYIIGVEAEPGDRDDTTHRIDVAVRRRGVTLRSRRAFVMAAARDASPPTPERMGDLLSSPFGVPDVPLRVTTFAMQHEDAAKVRLLLAADVGQPGAAAARYTIGWALIDGEGHIAASASGERLLSPIAGRADQPLGFVTPIVVEPGVYSLRLGVVDESGRRGSVVREVNAWKLRGEEFAVADLVVGPIPEAGNPLLPAVEPHVGDSLAGLIELYSTTPASFDRTAVTFEVADAEEGPALLTVPGQMAPDTAEPGARSVQAIVNPRALPAGRYVMRARISRDGQPAGLLVRPFVLMPPAAAAIPDNPPPLAIPRFERGAVMAPDVLGEILSGLERQSPSLREATAAARGGQYGAAALEALTAGAQEAAAFFKGLEWYVKGDISQAASQFNIAAGPRRTFFPAAFYLGAAYAAAGRDRDAAGVLQMSFGAEPRPAIAYALFADARLRDGQPQSVIDVLGPAWQRTPDNDELGQRLAVAYALTGRHAEALPVLEGYLSRHPDDQAALFAAILAQYEASTRVGVSLSDVERERLTRWARAYTGPQRALVDKYVDTLRAR